MLRGHVMLVERRGSWFSGTLLPSSWTHWLGVFCASLPPPPHRCIAVTVLCHVQKSGLLGTFCPFCGQPIHASLLPRLGKAEVGRLWIL